MSGIDVIRPVTLDDLNDVYDLAQKTGGGMTNLPPNRDALEARIAFSVESYEANVSAPGGEVYMLVLERDGRAVGTCAVFSACGLDFGFINYKVVKQFCTSPALGTKFVHEVLVPTHEFTGCAEVASLFLDPEQRGGGRGKLLARSRYLFMAQAPHLVASRIVSELRGWRAPDGVQPFWEAVGRRFFGMDFEDADVHNAANGNQFIEDLMPTYPIYTALLSDAARDCIGRPHEQAVPAWEMLKKEGFVYDGYVDVFDAGPLLTTRVSDLATVRESRTAQARVGEPGPSGREALVATGQGRTYRCVRTMIKPGEESVMLPFAAADALHIGAGAPIRWAAW